MIPIVFNLECVRKEDKKFRIHDMEIKDPLTASQNDVNHSNDSLTFCVYDIFNYLVCHFAMQSKGLRHSNLSMNIVFSKMVT